MNNGVSGIHKYDMVGFTKIRPHYAISDIGDKTYPPVSQTAM